MLLIAGLVALSNSFDQPTITVRKPTHFRRVVASRYPNFEIFSRVNGQKIKTCSWLRTITNRQGSENIRIGVLGGTRHCDGLWTPGQISASCIYADENTKGKRMRVYKFSLKEALSPDDALVVYRLTCRKGPKQLFSSATLQVIFRREQRI